MSLSYGIIYTVTLIMTSLVLDTFPTVDFNIPQTVSINTSPYYYGKRRFGQPLLGAQPKRPSSHFVPLIDSSPQVKQLLKIPENDTSPAKPIKGYTEILKDEQEKTETPIVSKKVYNEEFIEEALDYLKTPNYNRNASYFSGKPNLPTTAKNSANLANIVAAAQPMKRKPQPKLSKPGLSNPPMIKKAPMVKRKKPTSKINKITSFRILEKKKY